MGVDLLQLQENVDVFQRGLQPSLLRVRALLLQLILLHRLLRRLVRVLLVIPDGLGFPLPLCHERTRLHGVPGEVKGVHALVVCRLFYRLHVFVCGDKKNYLSSYKLYHRLHVFICGDQSEIKTLSIYKAYLKLY